MTDPPPDSPSDPPPHRRPRPESVWRIRLQQLAVFTFAATLVFILAMLTPLRQLVLPDGPSQAEQTTMDEGLARQMIDKQAIDRAVDDAGESLTEIRKPRSLRSLISWRNVGRASLLGIVCWLLTVVFITTVQRKLVFVGTSVFRNVDLSVGSTGWDERQLRDITVPMPDGLKLNGWLALATPSSVDDAAAVAGKPLVVYYGGNAGTRRFRLSSLRMLTEIGCNVLIVDYRGFADNKGKPSEEAFLRDGKTVIDHAVNKLNVPVDRIVLYGESLGGAVATGVASKLCEEGRTPGGLLLRATFASMTETAGYHYPFLPVGMLLIDRFPSVDRIAAVDCPVLQLHGDKDRVIPIEHARRLHAAVPEQSADQTEKRFVVLDGAGHNDILHVSYEPLRQETVDWMQSIGLLGK